MQTHHPPSDGEAEPGASARRALATGESFEDPVPLSRRDAGPVIAHLKHQAASG